MLRARGSIEVPMDSLTANGRTSHREWNWRMNLFAFVCITVMRSGERPALQWRQPSVYDYLAFPNRSESTNQWWEGRKYLGRTRLLPPIPSRSLKIFGKNKKKKISEHCTRWSTIILSLPCTLLFSHFTHHSEIAREPHSNYTMCRWDQ